MSQPEAAAPRTPEPSSADWRNAPLYQFIDECMDDVRSFAISARESAYRQERIGTELYLGQIRRCLVAAIEAFKKVE